MAITREASAGSTLLRRIGAFALALFLLAGGLWQEAQAATSLPSGQWAYADFTLPTPQQGARLVLSSSAPSDFSLYTGTVHTAGTPIASSSGQTLHTLLVPASSLSDGASYHVRIHASANVTLTYTYTQDLQYLRILTWDPGLSLAGSNLTSQPDSAGGDYLFQITGQAPVHPAWRTVLQNVTGGTADVFLQQGSVPLGGWQYTASSAGSGAIYAYADPSLNGQTWYLRVHALPGATWKLLSGDLYAPDLSWDPGNAAAGSNVLSQQSSAAGDYFYRVTSQDSATGAWRTVLKVSGGEADFYQNQGTVPLGGASYQSTRTGDDGVILSASQFSNNQTWYLRVHASGASNAWSIFSGEIYALNLGTLADSGSTVSFTGNQAPSGDISLAQNVKIGPEGTAYFKVAVDSTTLGWRLWLSGAGNTIWVRKNAAPVKTASIEAAEQFEAGQMLLVPPYLTNAVYFVGVTGTPGTLLNLDSRKQQITTVAFNSTTPATVTGFGYTTYRVEVPIQQVAWQVNLTPGSSFQNPELYLRQGNIPNRWINDGLSEAPAGVTDSITQVPPTLTDGTWYVTVYGSGSFSYSLRSGVPVVTGASYINDPALYLPVGSATYNPLTHYPALCPSTNPAWPCQASPILNDDTKRSGWRYYQVSDISSQLGYLGWQVDLAQQVAGSEIALRKNAVPARWNFRTGGSAYSTGISSSSTLDLSSVLGFLQHPGHPADIWYLGVYAPDQALGPFRLTTREIPSPLVTLSDHSPLCQGDPSQCSNSASVVAQPFNTWKWFKVTVPEDATLLGWDLRVKASVGSPTLAVRRDQLPPGGENNYGWFFGNSWSTGFQWNVGADWTGRSSNFNGTPSRDQNVVLGMGSPLEPGTYYVGVTGTSGYPDDLSYTVESRGIGIGNAAADGQPWPIQVLDMDFEGGSGVASGSNLQPRQAAYYRVQVPDGKKSWVVKLVPTLGEARLALRSGHLPNSLASYGYPAEGYGTKREKNGQEFFYKYPENGAASIAGGGYYLAVISEGQNPSGASIGTGGVNYTLTSAGEMPVSDKTGQTLSTSQMVTWSQESLTYGTQKIYRFRVPAGLTSIEVRLRNRVNSPFLMLQKDPAVQGTIPALGPGNGGATYVAQEGGTYPNLSYNDALLSVANPEAGDYTVAVANRQTCLADPPYTCGELDASYDLEVSAQGTTSLNYRNGSAPVLNQEAHTWRYFKVTVPAEGLGWDLRFKTTAGHPAMSLRRDLAPPGGPGDWWWQFGTTWPTGYQWNGGADWTGRPYTPAAISDPNQYLLLGLGSPLEPGTYYVGVSGNDTMSYTLESRGIGIGNATLDGQPWPLQVQDLSFNGAGNVKSGSNLTAREAAYYRVSVPAGSKSWVLNLTPTLGEASLALRSGTFPNSSASYGYGTEGYGTKRSKNGQEIFYKYPEGASTTITPGFYYVAVISEGQGPSGSNIGTGGVNYTLTSSGEMPIFDKTGQTLSAAAPVGWTSESLIYGAQKLYRFRVPAGLTSIEVRLKNRTNAAFMMLQNDAVGAGRIPALGPGNGGATYVAQEGGTYPSLGYHDSLISAANPVSGDYTLAVATRQSCLASYPYTCSELDVSYDVEVTAHVPTDVAFRDSSTPVASQDPGTWNYFKVTVPADAVGWDLRLKTTQGHPTMSVRRDQLPPGGYNYWAWQFGTTWPSGYQWDAGYDWTGRSYTTGGVTDDSRYLVLGLGSPLEPGTYYVAVTGSDTMSYSLVSRGIGIGKAASDGQSWPIQVQDLAFNGAGSAKSAVGLAARENAYYRLTVPAGSKSWGLNLAPTLGEARLVLRFGSLPNSSASYGYGTEGYGTKREKNGEEYFYKYPEPGKTTVSAGYYYIGVISEGQSPSGSNIGTGGVSYTLTSLGEMPVSDKTGQSLTVQTPIVWSTESLKFGAQKVYRFKVPVGLTSMEVRLKNRVNAPFMMLESPAGMPGGIPALAPGNGGASYVAQEGGVYPDLSYNDSLLSVANPQPGVYTLSVATRQYCLPSYPYTCSDSDAGYDVEVSAKTPIALAVDSGATPGHLVDQQYDYYQIEIPDSINGFPVAGLKIGTSASNGSVKLYVGKGNLPNTANQPTLVVTAPFVVLTPPYLAPGTWYVAVQGVGITDYTISSRIISADPAHHSRSWSMPDAGGSFPGCPDAGQANLLPSPLFGDAGVLGPVNGVCSKVDNPSTHDQGIDLAQDDWHFYRVNVPAGNGGNLRTVVEALSGKPELYIRRGSVPSLYHYDDANNPNNYYAGNAFERSQTVTGTMYGNWVPLDRRTETQLAPGEWWIGVRAVNSNVRYRLKVAAGNVRNGSGPVDSAGFFQDLDQAPGATLSGQTLAAGDMRYYRVTVPQSSTLLANSTPLSFTVNLQKQVGNVTVLVRDTIPPGQGSTGALVGASSSHSEHPNFQDWYDDNSYLPGTVYRTIDAVGDTSFSVPPVQPGKTYYLGVYAVSDASFDLSWKPGSSKLALAGTIPFVNGGVTTTLAAGETRIYRIDTPTNAVYWQQFAQHAAGISLYLAQDTVPTQDYAHWQTVGTLNSAYNRVIGDYPWQAGHNFYLLVKNTTAGQLPFTFVMNGVVASAGSAGLAPGNITTVAGGGVGNSSPAGSAILSYPKGVALDSAGNVYIADTNNHMVRKVSAATGIISTVAGTGMHLYGGDGGPASSAPLNAPEGVALDAAGNLYIADTGNQRVRKVSAATGIISTVAGNGSAGYSGDHGQASTASLYNPTGLTLDGAGNLYIADSNNYRIRKVNTAGVISTVAGGGVWGQLGDGGSAVGAFLYTPHDIAADAAGNLYIADSSNYRVRKVTAATGIISTIAGNGNAGYGGDGGQATAALFSTVTGLTLDGAGNLYICDSGNSRLRKLAAATGIITTLAGSGGGFSGDGGLASAAAMYPEKLALDAAGNIYIADSNNQRIRKITVATGIIDTLAGNGGSPYSGDGGQASGSALNGPVDVAADGAGNLYFADTGNHRIRKLTAATGAISTVAGNGSAGFSGDQGAALQASLYYPQGVAVDGSGNLYLADIYNCRIRKVDTAGMISTVAGGAGCGFGGDGGPAKAANLAYPQGIAVDGAGNLYIADSNNHRIRKVDGAGVITTLAGNGAAGFSGDGGNATDGQLYGPSKIALDGAGNLYIADYNNHRVRKLTVATGKISTVAGNGSSDFSGDGGAATAAGLSYPGGVALDPAGNLYISDSGNHRARRVDAASGLIASYAGNWNQGFSGDGGPATLASLNTPRGLALDPAGNLYIADSSNNRIREVIASVMPVTLAAPAAGSYGAPQSVTLTPNKPATTYYTTNGSTPTTASAVYSGPILLSASATVKFFSKDGAGNTEAVKTAAYSITMATPKTTAAPAGGVFSAAQNVTLSCNDGSGPGCGSTYYCLGSGCTPTTLYSFPVAVTGSQILRFYSKDTAGNSEPVSQASYTLFAGFNPSGSVPGGVGSIVTYAGGGVGGTGAGVGASLSNPQGVAFDAAGNVYLADTGNHLVRKVSAATGIISTVAGNGSAGFSGDGGPAVSARLSSPRGIALDGSGNLYIADASNHRIRKVDSAGVITTLAGNGDAFYPGDGSPAVASSINPRAVAVDAAGNLYLTDDSVIRKVDPAGVISTVAGGGTWGQLGDGGPATQGWIYNPQAIALDTAGNLYLADQYNQRIRKVTVATGFITTVAGSGDSGYGGDGGPASGALFSGPSGVSVDGAGNIYIVDHNNYRIRKVTAATGLISTVAGNGGGFSGDGGPASAAGMLPFAVAADAAGNLVIADADYRRIRRVSAATGIISTVAGNDNTSFSGDGGVAVGADLAAPQAVALDGAGNLYIADQNNHRIRKVNGATGQITTVAGNGSAGYTGDFGSAAQASLNSPRALTLDGAGNLYIADNSCRVRKVDTAGMISTVAGAGCGSGGDGGPATQAYLYYPQGLALDGSGNLYIADSSNNSIRKVDGTGIITTVAGDGTAGFSGDGGPATAGRLNYPTWVTADAAGNLYLADYNNHRIRKVAAGTGVISTVAGSGTPGYFGDGGPALAANLLNPNQVTLDGAGNLYIAEYGNNAVRRVDAVTGVIITVAGNGAQGFSGDGGPATLASLYTPRGLAVDPAGNIFIADVGNDRIREVVLNPVPVTSADPPEGSYSTPQSVTLSPSEPSTTYYTTDGSTPTTGSAVYSAPILLSASATLKFFSRDGAGNAESVKNAAYSITMAVPKTTASPAGGLFSTAQNVTLSCNDGSGPGCGSTYYCLGSGCTPATLYSSPVALTGSALLRFYSKDTAGHPEPVSQASYTVFAGYNPTGSVVGGAGTILSYAGGGFGNNSDAIGALLNTPQGVALDGAGNLYLADAGSHLVRKVSAATGIITTVAGTGSPGFSGDGGPATSASLNNPKGVAVDSSGNLYIVDLSNHRIRRVDTAGVITTVAGNGDSFYPGDGGPAVAASIAPVSVAVDGAKNLYFSDGNYLRKVDAVGVISTLAGGGAWGEPGDGGPATAAWLYGPQGVALDAAGNLYLAEANGHRVRKIDAATGIITSFAGTGSAGYGGDGGPAGSARFSYPTALSLDGAGNLYIADANNYRIRKVVAATGRVSTVAGAEGGSYSDGALASSVSIYPNSVASDTGGNFYFADSSSQRIYQVSAATGVISMVAGSVAGSFSGDGGLAAAATLATPQAVALDGAGNLYIADQDNHRIRKVNGATGAITTVAGNGSAGFSGDFEPATHASLSYPHAVALDGAGNLYIADTNNCRIRKVDTAGMISTVAGAGCSTGGDGGPATEAYLYYPQGVALDGSGNLYIADSNANRIRKVDGAGTITTVAGDGSAGFSGDGGPGTAGRLNMPTWVSADAAGNLYLADYNNHRVRKVAAGTGIITTVAGSGNPGYFGDGGQAGAANLLNPAVVTLDAGGNLYIADYGNNTVRRVDAATGVIQSVAGNRIQGFSGDGGPATLASLYFPRGLAVDPTGNIFIADAGNDRIREVVLNPVPVTSANPPAGSYGAPQSVQLSSSKPATTYYTTNGSTPTTSSSVYSTPILLSASATLKFFSRDGAGNTESVKSAVYSITMAAPKTTAVPAGGLFSVPQNVTLSCNDGSGPGCGSTYYCLGTGCAPTVLYSSPIAVTGSQVLRFYSKDSAGHSEAVSEAGYTIFSGYGGGGALPGGLGIITSYAGGGVGNYSAATGSILYAPQGVALDADGNIYLADTKNHLVRKVTAATGIISTVAGTGSAGYSGDGGPGNQAALNNPQGVALDPSGNLYIADLNNHRIRKVDTAGIISTVAGNGDTFYPGDGSPAVAASISPQSIAVDGSGNLYLSDGNLVRKVDPAGIIGTVAGGGSWGQLGDGGAATAAWLYSPQGLAVDSSGNLYIADYNNHRIRKVSLSTGIISTVAGSGSAGYAGDGGQADAAQLYYPTGVALDGAGNFYIADRNNYRVRKVTVATGTISTVAGNGSGGFSGDGGPASTAGITPFGLALDGSGNLYLAEADNSRIRKVTAATGKIGSVAGNGSTTFSGDGGFAASATLYNGSGVATDLSGNLYFADRNNHRVRKVNAATGVISTVAGNGTPGASGDQGAAGQASLYSPSGVALDAAGNLFIADTNNCRIRKVDSSGIITTVAGGNGCGYGGDGGPASAAYLYYPTGIAVDSSGSLYLTDTGYNRVRKVNSAGIISTIAGNGSSSFSGDGGPASTAGLNPNSVALDAAGNLYLADLSNNRIRKISAPTGIISTVAGTGKPGFFGDGGAASSANLLSPAWVALDSAGNLYLSDGSNRVRRVDAATGTIVSVAGNSTPGFSGDGGPAVLARLNNPQGVALDSLGNIFIADASNNRIRKVSESILCSVSLTPGQHGSINGPTQVNYGSMPSYQFVPDTGYHVTGATVNGVQIGALPGYSYSSWITSNQALTVSFAINVYTVSFSAGANGSISPSASQSVNHGASATTVTASANAGYHLVNWTDAGGAVLGTAPALTLTNVTGNLSARANFAFNTYSITTSAAANGAISASQTVNQGANSAPVTVTPNAGYHIAWVKADNVSQTVNNQKSFSISFSAVSANHTVSASFTPDTGPKLDLTLVSSTGGAGTVNSNPAGIACATGTCSAYFGSGTGVTLMPSAGANSVFSGWTGACSATSGNCVLSMTADKAVSATFDFVAPARIDSTPPVNFNQLQAAYNAIATGGTIQARDYLFTENLVLSRNVAIYLDGGHDTGYASTPGFTRLRGSLFIRSGALRVDKLLIH